MADPRDTPIDPAALPALGAPVPDTHAHLDMLPNAGAALARAAMAGVDLVLTVVDLTEEGEAWLEELPAVLSAARSGIASAGSSTDVPLVRIVAGTHPHNASAWSSGAADRLLALAERPDVVAIGEVGLDFHYDNSPRDSQRAMFREQLGIAHEAGLPVIVHLREAHEEGETILREAGVPEAGAVIHCFTEGPGWVERFVAMGCHVSFSGLATFKKAEAIREAARAVPLDRLLVETDAPFLAPEPFRGRTNEPALVTLTARRIAEARGISAEELAAAVEENARRLFGVGEGTAS